MNQNYPLGHRRDSRDIDAMVSVQNPNILPNSAFGFALDPFPQQHFYQPDPPPEPAPEPAPGQSLLSDSDHRSLDALFRGIEYNTPQSTVEEGLNFTESWILPPQYVGSTTSYGVQPLTPAESPTMNGFQEHFHGSNEGPATASSSMMPPPPLPHAQSSVDQHPTADVLAAAHLLQNGSMSQQMFGANQHGGGHFAMGPQGQQGTHMGHFQQEQQLPTRPAWQNQQQQPHQMHMSPNHMEDDLDKTFVNMYAGQQGPRQSRPNTIQPIKWGSDESFARGKFIPQNPKETSEAMEQERLMYIECLEPNKSAANTRPSSPVPGGSAGLTSPLRLKTRDGALLQLRDDPDAPAAKRRKSKAKEEPDDDTPSSIAGLSHIKTKPDPRFSNPYASASPPAPGGGSSSKRRKSSAKGAGGGGNSKTPRENLTEDQKRENHIKSEQKRREVIKKGFEDLCDLVPEAKGGQFSKSAILVMTAEWLEQMLQGNEILRQQAKSMGLEVEDGA